MAPSRHAKLQKSGTGTCSKLVDPCSFAISRPYPSPNLAGLEVPEAGSLDIHPSECEDHRNFKCCPGESFWM